MRSATFLRAPWLAGIWLLWGCAAESPPRPPRIQRPAKVNDLAVFQVGRTLELSFQLPVLATDGRRLTKPIEAEIFRCVTPQDQRPAREFVAVKPQVSIGPEELDRLKRGQKIIYDDPVPERDFAHSLGATFSFAMMTLTRGFRGRPRDSDLSNIAMTKLLDVSPPPEGVHVVQRPQALDLSWSAPVRGLDGGPLPALVEYRIYRSEQSPPDTFRLEGKTPAPQYRDAGFQFNRIYFYKVRAVFEQMGHTAESAGSRVVEITPRDIFPPDAPLRLGAVYTGKAVQLIWNPVVAPDLAGYNVYRQAPGEVPRRLNQDLLKSPAFEDVAIAQGSAYVYWVTAVDLARNESQPSVKVRVETR
jgi:hypothetical protein